MNTHTVCFKLQIMHEKTRVCIYLLKYFQCHSGNVEKKQIFCINGDDGTLHDA